MYPYLDKNECDTTVISLGCVKLTLALELAICNWEGICDHDYVICDFKGILHRVLNT